jgi:hypothetical protein
VHQHIEQPLDFDLGASLYREPIQLYVADNMGDVIRPRGSFHSRLETHRLQ